MNVEDQLNQLSPEKQQAVIRQLAMQAQQEALSNMMEKMTEVCFKKCAGTSGDKLDSREQSCLALCQDRFFDSKAQVTEALQKRQDSMR
mmetsp:Transcript_4185/g.8071  ORF Transcript_4185/g.8071 Transcript_4185/m.8071 type:complete len:89 (+) Transcript_4185:196-462(+)